MAGEVNEFREWLLVGGTVGAVVVALGATFYERLRAWRQKPKLSLLFDPAPDDEALDLVTVRGEPISHWLRIRIENGSGRQLSTRRRSPSYAIPAIQWRRSTGAVSI